MSFLNNGPIAAHNAVRNYIASVGLNGFPEDYRASFQTMLAMPLFEGLTDGVERLYAAARQLADLPFRDDALLALGEASQASALAGLAGKRDRWWAIQAWTLAEINEPGVDNPLAPAPEIEPAFSFIPEVVDIPEAPPEPTPPG